MFCNALILIALRGGRDAVGEYLVRARTEVVDVDSAGRKVRAAARRGCRRSRGARAVCWLPLCCAGTVEGR